MPSRWAVASMLSSNEKKNKKAARRLSLAKVAMTAVGIGFSESPPSMRAGLFLS